MYLNETYAKKWAPVLDHSELPKITDPYKRAVTALVLENQERALMEESRTMQNLWETSPANAVGGGMSPVVGSEGGIKGFDPILAMRSVYASASARGGEALYTEANTAHSGTGDHTLNTSVNFGEANDAIFGLANTGTGMATTTAEDLTMKYMGFQIDRVSVTAKSRGLQAAYTLELAQDLKAIHGLDAETELTNILSTEILAEINREVVVVRATSSSFQPMWHQLLQ